MRWETCPDGDNVGAKFDNIGVFSQGQLCRCSVPCSALGNASAFAQSYPMQVTLRLASGSQTRRQLLENAGLTVEAQPARIDEENLREGMEASGVTPRDMSDALAEMKAKKVSQRFPADTVLGCDQVLEFERRALGKAPDLRQLKQQMLALRGKSHMLFSAAVLYRDGSPIWRQIGEARMQMTNFSDEYLETYISRNGEALLGSVGGYLIESEGLRLFQRIDGDYFTVLGLPLLPLLQQLGRMGEIDT